MQEEVGIVGERDILVVLEDAQLDNGWRIHRTSVSARLGTAATGASAFGLLDYLQVVTNTTAILGLAMRSVFCLIGDGND